jgi:CcmD family protein
MNGNLEWLFAAFAVAWIVIFSYLFHISRKERALRRRVKAIEDLLEGK